MNPDKLFNYLEGKLSAEDREKLEDQLVRDPELQREFAMARKIHERMTGNIREVILDDAPPEANRGRQIMRRVMIVFLALIFINTVVGVLAIGLLENRKKRTRIAAEQNRKEMTLALQNAAANALPTPVLVDEIKIAAPAAQIDSLVEKISAAARQVNGSAAKNVTNENGTLVFAEIPAERVSEFHDALKQLGAIIPTSSSPSRGSGNMILQIRITPQPG